MKQPVSAADVYVNKSTRLLTGLSQISADSASPTDTGPVTPKSTSTLRSKTPLMSSPPPRTPRTRQTNENNYHHHLSLNREDRWGTDDFATSFLYFSLFSTALWDLANSRPVHYLMMSSHLFLCLPCLVPPFTAPCQIVLARPDERET